MESLYNKYKDRGFEMLAVNVMETEETVSDFRKYFDLSFPILLDKDGKINSSYGIQAIPTTFLINREGQIVVRFVGSMNWDTLLVRRALEALLDS
jgi:peroxiredoxin